MKKIFCTIAITACLASNALATDAGQEVFTASSFNKAISEDVEAVKEKYLEKNVVIKGTVSRTYISKYLTPCVELASDNPKITFVLPYGGITRGAGGLSNFKVGQNVTMTGILRGITDEIVVFKESKAVE